MRLNSSVSSSDNKSEEHVNDRPPFLYSYTGGGTLSLWGHRSGPLKWDGSLRFEIEFGVRIRVIIGDIFKTIKVKGGGGGAGRPECLQALIKSKNQYVCVCMCVYTQPELHKDICQAQLRIMSGSYQTQRADLDSLIRQTWQADAPGPASPLSLR